MITKHPINSPNVVDRRRTKDQLDRNVFDSDRWKLESELPFPGPISFDSVSGSNGVIQISVSQLNGDKVDGWEMCHADSGVTSPTGLAYTFESGGKFLIASSSPRNLWVRGVIGLKKGVWQGYGEAPLGAEIFTQKFNDATCAGSKWTPYPNTTAIIRGNTYYGTPSGILTDNYSSYATKTLSLFNQTGGVTNSLIGGRLSTTVAVSTCYGSMNANTGCGMVFLATASMFSDANQPAYGLGIHSLADNEWKACLWKVSGQVWTLVASSTGTVNSYGSAGNHYGQGTQFLMSCIFDRNGNTFKVLTADGNTVIWTYTATDISPTEDMCHVGLYYIGMPNYFVNSLLVQSRNYAGELTTIGSGTFVDPIKDANLSEVVKLSRYVRLASGNAGDDSVRVRWNDNLQVVAERYRPAETLQETVVLNPKFKVGTLTRDASAATGTVATTGLGFKPRAIQFDWVLDGTTISGRAVYDGTTLSGTTFTTTWAQTSSIDCYTSGTNRQYATVSSLDTDGFTLSWTKVDSPTGTIKITYFAFQ